MNLKIGGMQLQGTAFDACPSGSEMNLKIGSSNNNLLSVETKKGSWRPSAPGLLEGLEADPARSVCQRDARGHRRRPPSRVGGLSLEFRV